MSLWREQRAAARRGELSHEQLLALLEANAAAARWRRIERWLIPLLQHAVVTGERQGSAIALAAWLQRQRRSLLAARCLELVDWEQADAQAWLLRAQISQRLGQSRPAQHSLIRALVLPGGQAVASYRLGQWHRASGDFDQAAAWFLASLQCDPEPFHIHNELQFTRCSDALLPELVNFYTALCRLHPQRALTRQLLAHYLARQGDLDAACRESRAAARLELGSLEPQLAPADAAPTPPDFLILGVPKGGTTAVLRWLDHQPGLWCHPRKELHFFDGRYDYGTDWYCSQFPRFQDEAKVLRGEATPNYFSHTETPGRIAALMPAARLVVLLRDPLSRAVSWVQHLQRLEGLEGSVESWLQWELQQLNGLSADQLEKSPRIGTGALQDSCYDLHLQRWKALLPRAPLLLISSDQLFTNPAPVLTQLLSFLQQAADPFPWLDQWRPLNVNPTGPAPLTASLRADLSNFLQAQCHNTWSALADQGNGITGSLPGI